MQNNEELKLALLIALIAMLMMAFFVISFVMYYQKKKFEEEKKNQRYRKNYNRLLLDTALIPKKQKEGALHRICMMISAQCFLSPS
jgi:flagellar basal body-associated protein FliL